MPKPALTRERIATAAVGLLDEVGVAGLTMRGLAQALGVTATALYWHVATKDDVLDLAADHVFAEVPLRRPGRRWRADVRALVRDWRTAMLAHPWVTGLIGRSVTGPNVRARIAFLQAALGRGGLSGRRLEVTTRLVANFVIGAAVTEHAGGRTAADDRLFAGGLDTIMRAADIH